MSLRSAALAVLHLSRLPAAAQRLPQRTPRQQLGARAHAEEEAA